MSASHPTSPGPSRLAWFNAEISSRSLALLRILISSTLLFNLVSPWVSHRMDDQAGVLLLSWTVIIGSFVLCLGYKTRITAVVVALAFAILHGYYGYYYGNGGIPKLTLHFQVLQALVLLALTPCGRSLSVDRILEVRRAKREGTPAPPERMPAWVLELFVLQTVAVYLWGAFDMAEGSWLSGTRLELYFIDLYGNSDSFIRFPRLLGFAQAGAWFGLISTLAVGVGLLARRTRPYVAAYALVLQCFVLWVYSLNWGGSYFNIMMVNMLLACVPPAHVHRLITTVIKGPERAEAEAEAKPEAKVGRPWVGPLALGLALLAFHVPPTRAMVFEHEASPFVWDWALHDPIRTPYCELRFYDLNREGAPIERWRVLGSEDPDALPKNQDRVRRNQIRKATREVCKGLQKQGDKKPRVELEARCPVGREWEQVASREKQLCQGSALKPMRNNRGSR